MALKVQTSGHVEVPTISMLVCGPGGAGKTRFAATAPHPFFISAEAGLLSVRDKDVPFVEVGNREDILGVLAVLQSPSLIKKHIGRPVETVVVDTFDEVLKLYKRSRVEETKKGFAIQDWDWLSEQLQGLVRGLRALPMHLILTCHLKDETDGESGELWFEPALQGQIKPWIPTAVDIAVAITSTTKLVAVDGEKVAQVSRFLQTYPDRHHRWIKDRFGGLPPQVPVDFTNDFQRIFEAAYGELEPPTTLDESEQADPVKVDSTPAPADDEAPVVPVEGSTGPVDITTGEIPPKVEEKEEEELPRADSPLRGTDGAVCETCGKDVPPNRADLSKLKFKGTIYCEEHYKEALRG